MENLFFEKPILNSSYEYPARHWELDAQGQPTQKIIESDFKSRIEKEFDKMMSRFTAGSGE